MQLPAMKKIGLNGKKASVLKRVRRYSSFREAQE